MTLDEELIQILHDRRYQQPDKPGYNDVINMNVKAIKQAFEDAGYRPPVENKMLTTDNGV